MPQFQLPYEITKLFEIIEDPLTKEKTINIDKNYAYIIQDNFDQILQYINKGISGENLTTLAKKNIIHLKPQDAVLPTTGAPALVKIDGTNHSYYVLDFDPDAIEYCYWHFTIPLNWNAENITARIKYIANATSGNVVWMIRYKGISETESIDQATTSEVFPPDIVDATANNLCIKSRTFALTGVTAGEWVIFKLQRFASSASDTLAVDARVLEVVIEWGLS